MTEGDEAIGTEPAAWHVIVEETVGFGRQGHRFEMTEIQPCASREEALDLAERLAVNFQPEHPTSPRARRVFQVGEDCWLVDVEGMMHNYYFRVSVARLIHSS